MEQLIQYQATLLKSINKDFTRYAYSKLPWQSRFLGIKGFKGDIYIEEEKLTLEIGGKNKTLKQIQNIPNSYVFADDIEMGFGRKIPLYLLGFLY